MASLKRAELRVIDDVLEMTQGYVLNFSDRTIAEFFEDELGVELYDIKYEFNGTSKAKRVRAFMEVEENYIVAKMLREMWRIKRAYNTSQSDDLVGIEQESLFRIINRLEEGGAPPVLKKLSQTAEIYKLDTVSRDLERAVKSIKTDPESAVTSACSTLESVARSILIELELELPKKKDLKALFNAVKEPLGLSPGRTDINMLIADDVRKIFSGLSTVVEGISALRTHGGDAHGREKGYARIDQRIASLAVHSASSIALFLLETWNRKFPTKNLHKH